MPKVDPDALTPGKLGSDYPAPFDVPVSGRIVRDLAKAMGATDWIANHVVVPSDGWSSQRRWHEGEDEIVVVLAGEAVLIDERGRRPMRTGDIAVFPKGGGNGHHLINDSDTDCILLAISQPNASPVRYPDIGLRWAPETGEMHVDGTPY